MLLRTIEEMANLAFWGVIWIWGDELPQVAQRRGDDPSDQLGAHKK